MRLFAGKRYCIKYARRIAMNSGISFQQNAHANYYLIFDKPGSLVWLYVSCCSRAFSANVPQISNLVLLFSFIGPHLLLY